MARIELKNLTKQFGDKFAVKDQNLIVNQGEFLILLGPSGCGKTTTLNCIAGLEIPSSGEIFFNNNDVTNDPPHSRNVAMVFQSALLYPHLNCKQNILMSLKKTNLSDDQKEQRINESVSILNIKELMHKKPHQLSGGERQRVATAKAIVRQPDVFLLDEPMAALDAALRQTLRSELVNLQKKLNTTTVFVTHDQVEAMTMGDRIAVMNNGKVEQIGTPIEIYNKPKTKFVAGFVGSPPMNFLKGKITQKNGNYNFEVVNTSDNILLNADTNNISNNDTLAFRPQHASIVSNDDYDIELKIFGIENLGKELIIICEYNNDKIRIITENSNYNINDIIKIKIDKNKILFF
ncbi:ABC transporter ATP-binding protein [Pelagibacteraceae bacterium]|nr:ABC transporter ATP-binding protein [Pelagibacteraceae bacterium]